MAAKYEARKIKSVVLPVGEPIFSEKGTTIEIVDDAAGEYVKVQQNGYTDGGIAFDAYEWEFIKAEIESMLAECRPDDFDTSQPNGENKTQ